jgi:hypothetical protein
MAQGLDIKAFTDGVVTTWWHWALVVIIITSTTIGIAGAIWTFWKFIRRIINVRSGSQHPNHPVIGVRIRCLGRSGVKLNVHGKLLTGLMLCCIRIFDVSWIDDSKRHWF